MKPQVFLVGNLARDTAAVFSDDNGNHKRALFTVACNNTYKKEDGEKVKSVDFIPCIAWNGLAEAIQEWGLKGRKIQIRGTLESFQKPVNEDGSYDPQKVQVRVVELEFLGLEDNVKKKLEARKAEAPVPEEQAPVINQEALLAALAKLLTPAA